MYVKYTTVANRRLQENILQCTSRRAIHGACKPTNPGRPAEGDQIQ
jgi:hypothetical protein